MKIIKIKTYTIIFQRHILKQNHILNKSFLWRKSKKECYHLHFLIPFVRRYPGWLRPPNVIKFLLLYCQLNLRT